MQLHQPILLKSLVTTALATVAAVLVFAIGRMISHEAISARNWIEATVIPVIVGFPICLVIFGQSERLREAHRNLGELNRRITSAHQELSEAHRIIAHAARHDAMTGLLNRKCFMDELSEAMEQGVSGALLFVDADYFKRINDKFGHLEGDRAIVTVATCIQEAVGQCGMVGRIGGEEFAVLMRNVNALTAPQIANSVRQRIRDAASSSPHPSCGGLSVSIGVALICEAKDASSLVQLADERLYQAKKKGRDRVQFASAAI